MYNFIIIIIIIIYNYVCILVTIHVKRGAALECVQPLCLVVSPLYHVIHSPWSANHNLHTYHTAVRRRGVQIKQKNEAVSVTACFCLLLFPLSCASPPISSASFPHPSLLLFESVGREKRKSKTRNRRGGR